MHYKELSRPSSKVQNVSGCLVIIPILPTISLCYFHQQLWPQRNLNISIWFSPAYFLSPSIMTRFLPGSSELLFPQNLSLSISALRSIFTLFCVLSLEFFLQSVNTSRSLPSQNVFPWFIILNLPLAELHVFFIQTPWNTYPHPLFPSPHCSTFRLVPFQLSESHSH